MKHIVDISGGNASAVCLFRVIERFGTEDVVARFADTKSEDPDLYRFLDDVERVAGVPIVRLQDGRTKWDVFHEKGMMTNPKAGGCLAAYHLKKVMLRKHAEEIATPETATIYIGFGPFEEDRCERIIKSGAPWKFDFPLLWRPLIWRCDADDFLKAKGIKTCEVYDEGYPHNNCDRCCILAGNKQWTSLLLDSPERFAREEAEEQKFLAGLRAAGRNEFTILTDRRGGVKANLSLKQLREEVEQGIRREDDAWRETSCACMNFQYDE